MNENAQDVQNKILMDFFAGTTVLVTGATGFLGQNLVKCFMEFNEREGTYMKCRVIALCRSKEKACRIFEKYLCSNRLVVINQDITVPISISEDVDYIFHTASPSNADNIKNNPVEVLQANVIGTDQVLKLAKSKNVKGVLFFSSGAVYGNTEGLDHCVTEEESRLFTWSESHNSYSIGKMAGENLCYSYHIEYGVPCKVVRLSHTYGPGIDLEDGHIYSDFAKALLERYDLQLYSHGLSKRAFCYVTDAIFGMLLIMIKGKDGEAYNLANVKEHYSIRQLAIKLAKEVYPRLNLKVINSEEKTAVELEGDYPMDISKLRALGWEPFVDVVAGFRSTVESFRNEQSEYKSIKNYRFGIMQGRLTPSNERGIQFFPFDNWEKEFVLAKEIGIDEIEFIFDYDRYDENPLWTNEGVSRIKSCMEESGVTVSAVCFDYFMRRPFFKKVGEERETFLLENKRVLEHVLRAMYTLGIKLIEIPLVDDSSMKTKEEQEAVIDFLKCVFENRNDGIRCGLETDLPPKTFKRLLHDIDMDGIGANYDSGNSSGLGYDPYEEIITLSDHIFNIHIKDRVLGGTTKKLGTGSADFPKLFKALAEVQYGGSFIFQAARGEDGFEKETIREQMHFIHKYLEQM